MVYAFVDFFKCTSFVCNGKETRHYLAVDRASYRIIFCECCGTARVQTPLNVNLDKNWVFGTPTGTKIR